MPQNSQKADPQDLQEILEKARAFEKERIRSIAGQFDEEDEIED